VDQEARASRSRYDPGVVYLLELCTVLALRDTDTIAGLGKRVADALFDVLRTATERHHTLVSRAAYYLLQLLRAGYVRWALRHSSHESSLVNILPQSQDLDIINVPILLHTLSAFPEDTLSQTAPLILQGLGTCIEDSGPLRNEIMTSPDFWALLNNTAAREDLSQAAFTVLERGIGGSPSAILSENYEAALSLLSGFASAASSANRSAPTASASKMEKRATSPGHR
jgi:brefeldin A-resistance guanine nucleotide exchange factor 1